MFRERSEPHQISLIAWGALPHWHIMETWTSAVSFWVPFLYVTCSRTFIHLPSLHLALALEKGYFHCHNKLHSEPFLKSTIAGSRDTRLYTWWPQQAEKSYRVKLPWEPPTAARTLNCPCRRVRSAGSGQRRNNRQKDVNVYFRGRFCLTAREGVFKWK